MPSKRDPNKKNVTLWLEKGNVEKLNELAKDRGVPLKDLIEEAIRNQCELWGVDYNEYLESKFSNRTDKNRKDDD
jgi:hypothetical protein